MLLLDAISEVELFLDVFVSVYVLSIFVYVLTSWIQLPYSLRRVQTFFFFSLRLATARHAIALR